MTGKGYTKLKLLYIKQYLEKYSDEDNLVKADELLEMLSEKGIDCERKSIYSDISALKNYGVDISNDKRGYRILARDFELPELRLLMDAVQAANFISAKKSKELISKICNLCSKHQAKILEKQVYIDNRNKCTNEEIYYNIDLINKAILQKKKISFTYIKRVIDEENKEIVREEKELTVSPYALIWSNDHYYLVSNNSKYDNLMHTRIDRMKKVEITSEPSRDFSEVSPYGKFFDSADYSGKLFNMFSGDTRKLVLRCKDSILEEMIDRFGDECKIRKSVADKQEQFTLETKCVYSEGLVSWLMQFGDKVQVISPESLRDDIVEKAESIRRIYCED
ncbi:MAG: WYL domain-containing protein [Clostridia bacterium]|nr:WYL domain-containing protein [Oscillospiraceae bacterium]MBQ7004921.1 WYL domain-containing protein [Clostridia bacterium]